MGGDVRCKQRSSVLSTSAPGHLRSASASQWLGTPHDLETQTWDSRNTLCPIQRTHKEKHFNSHETLDSTLLQLSTFALRVILSPIQRYLWLWLFLVQLCSGLIQIIGFEQLSQCRLDLIFASQPNQIGVSPNSRHLKPTPTLWGIYYGVLWRSTEYRNERTMRT